MFFLVLVWRFWHRLIRSLAQILCDDLAIAEEATDGKKKFWFGVLVVFRFCCVCGFVVFCLFCVFLFVWSPSHTDKFGFCRGPGSLLRLPKEETMQDALQFVQLTQRLCYDLAS